MISLVCKRLHSFHLYPTDTRYMHPQRGGTGSLLARAKLLMNQTRLPWPLLKESDAHMCACASTEFLWDTCLMPCEQIK